MTITKFIISLKAIACSHKNSAPTEKYLRRLLVQIDRNKDKNPSSKLFLELFESALFTSPCNIKSDWNEINEPEFYDDNDMKTKNIDALKYVIDTIKFFIADLKRMENKELKDPYRYYGVTSLSGAR